ncbi:MAG TPA: copper amine oxidase N-terminal domain-containing protein [bacterium]|nr:copper amine oxidase N-terminal domain-containing protein [bacterium]
MKRLALVALLLACAAVSTSVRPASAQQGPIRVYIDGQSIGFDVPPMVSQNRVFVPLRGIFERLGATVDYDAATQHIVAIRGGQTVELTIGSRQARVNNTPALLDVPAFTIGGRAMVPLRFISESLGASVQWVDASQTILIGSAGASPPLPPQGEPSAVPPPPPAQNQTISGRLMAVSTGGNPRIVVRSGGQDSTIAVLPDTSIFRYNAETHTGGSAPLGALRNGDQVTVIVNDQGQAMKITADYRVVAGGRIVGVNSQERTVTLANGRTFVVMDNSEITLNGQPADWGALQSGRSARFLVVAGTNQAYAVRVVNTTQNPPQSVIAPQIETPVPGAQVGNTFSVRGMAQPGALVVVKAQPKLLGQAAQAQTTADLAGRWRVPMNLTSLPFVTFPYVVSAIEVVNGVQSDPASIEVNVH